MMLCKLSLKNIKKSFKDYAIYFFTLILGVSIFYVFNAIDSQTVLLDVTSSTMELIKLMTNMLSGVSVFVSFILGFLIIYASRFLIKRRNKEFGIYMTLGMSKRKISMILFIETVIIGIISLVVGLGLGVLLSQLMSLLVSNMFEADMTKFEFVFSSSACLKTLIYFGIMYLLVMIFNTYNISKCKLIDLLHANKKSEEVKLKNPVLCTIIFIIACGVLGTAYYMVTGGVNKLQNANQIFIPIIMGVVSTFFIFWSLSGLLLRIFQSSKKHYYKGLNSFTLRQISSKINTTVVQMTIICLMLFVTICVLSSSLCLKNSMSANINELAPADLELTTLMNINKENNTYTEIQKENSKYTVKEKLESIDLDLNEYIKDYVEINTYHTPALTFRDTLGSKLDIIQDQYKFMNYDTQEDIVKLSEYNKLASFYGNEEFTLSEDEYIIIADFESMLELRNMSLNDKENIKVFGRTLKPKYTECQDGFIDMSSNHINPGIIIVSDSIVDESYIYRNHFIANYKADSKEERIKTEKIVIGDETAKKLDDNNLLVDGTSKLAIAEASIGLGAMATFIGLYLGIVFLISSAAILALKELSESSDNKERFDMLRRIGADESMINKALFRQIAIFFMFPLFIAIIHSIFGIQFCSFILSTFGNEELLSSIIMTSVFLVIIYGGYFIITYLCSKNIIKEKR